MHAPLVSALEQLLSPRARQESDVSTARDFNVRNHALGLPPGLSLRWLGTAGFELSYAGHVVLIDPYLTRPKLRAVVGSHALHSSKTRVERYVGAVDAILVGHTHFDHALDVPRIARLRGARVYGSHSAARLMRLHGLGQQAVEAVPGQIYEVGPFSVTFIESLHAKLLLGLAVPSSGELTCENLDELHGAAYRCGQVFGIHVAVAGVTFYHQGSANLIEERIPYRNIDYLLAGIAGRSFTQDYTARVLRTLSPRVVVPHHYDDFFRPLDAEAGFSLNVNLGGFVEEVERVSKDFRISTLDLLQSAVG
jgi:L-ascorbate metabolism protein UlaG (beta-lactamase superfamily)